MAMKYPLGKNEIEMKYSPLSKNEIALVKNEIHLIIFLGKIQIVV
jgi:hypothetical protein